MLMVRLKRWLPCGIRSQKNVAQSGDEDVKVDCEHIFFERSVMMVTMRDPVKSQNVSVLGGGPVLLHRVAPLLDQSWHLFDIAGDEDHNV